MSNNIALIFDIVADADLIRQDTGQLTTRDIICIMLRYKAPSLRWTFAVLIANGRAPKGCYERLLERGFQVREAIETVKAEIGAES